MFQESALSFKGGRFRHRKRPISLMTTLLLINAFSATLEKNPAILRQKQGAAHAPWESDG